MQPLLMTSLFLIYIYKIYLIYLKRLCIKIEIYLWVQTHVYRQNLGSIEVIIIERQFPLHC
jgi:hypothetical protein